MLPDNILGWLVVGVVAGALGKLIMPGKDPGGLIVTILLGIAGAYLAYVVIPLIGLAEWIAEPSWFKTIVASTIGAVVLLGLYRVVMAKRR
ncbi:GlsB/YeaQ/YmgE family stress response membrane protein [Sphingomonas canadensis]|uniref:GlsB/YeaQ/YmgE family stress response membrane protein n=1 Tax=Sphingomonas canadensis TaxID=1219257 RepID=A0ABW3H309_9SPHN|nr:GlsB/YeaQ/YmgE family stress response membrane protein [Sphingomonas canadensis]MCW3835004.1 GlsB/YeaQ/YmgE family stress response membrane protein [Sphingomonas canadensis]